MPLNTDKVRIAYNAISQDYDVGDFETFTSKMNEPSKRRLVYESLSEKYDIGETFEDFDAKVWKNEPQTLPKLKGTGFKNVGNQILGGIAEAEADFFGGLDNLAKYVGEKTGTESGGLFEGLADQNRQYADYFKARGIDPTAGRLYSIASKVYGGGGRAIFDVPLMATMGLPAYSGLAGAGEAAGEGSSVGMGAVVGAAEGALMHGIFKGLGVFKPGLRVPAGGAVMAGQTMLAELQKPADQRDWEAVAASGITGMGLMAIDPSPGMKMSELKSMVRDTYGKTKVKQIVKQVEEGARIVGWENDLNNAVVAINEAQTKPSATTVDVAKAQVNARKTVERLATDKLWAHHPEYVGLKDQIRRQNVKGETETTEQLPKSRLGYILLRDQLTNEQFKSDVYNKGLLDLKAASKQLHLMDKSKGVEAAFKAIHESARAVSKLHGGDILTSGIPIYTPEGYKAAKPHFEKAWQQYKIAGKSFKQFVEDTMTRMGENVTPYLKQLESEHREPTQINTSTGPATVPSGSRLFNTTTPTASALPVDPKLVARAVVSRRNKRASKALERGDLLPDEIKKYEKDATSWESRHPAHKAAMVDQITEMLNGQRKMAGEVGSVIKTLQRGTVDDSYLKGTAASTDVVLTKGVHKFTAQDLDNVRAMEAEGDIKYSKTNYLMTPYTYIFKRMGKKTQETYQQPYLEADHKINLMRKSLHTAEKDAIHKAKQAGLSKDWEERIFLYGASVRNEIGRKTLKSMGKTIPKWEELTHGDQQMYEFYRKNFDTLHSQSNMANRASGKAEMAYDGDYVPFMRQLNEYEMVRGNPLMKKLTTEESNRFFRPNGTPFPFAKELTKNDFKLNTNLRYAFNVYSNMATEHIFKSPIISRHRQMLNPFMDAKGNKIADMKDSPMKFRMLQEFVNTQANVRDVFITPAVDKMLYKLNANLGAAIMSGAIRSTLIQPSAIKGTLIEIGPEFTIKGIRSMFRKGEIDQAMKESLSLNSRFAESYLADLSETVAQKAGKIRKGATDVGLYGLKILDFWTATATYIGAKKHATEKLGLKGNDAIRYADDIVTRTQASASKTSRAPIQNKTWGKMWTLFQTFNINDFAYLRYNVFGLGNKEMTNKDRAIMMAKAVWWTSVVNTVYESLGMRSPYPSPIRSGIEAYQEAMDSDDDESAALAATKAAGLELLEAVPILGSIRYGTGVLGPLASLPVEAGDVIAGRDPIAKSLYLSGKIVGIPGTQQMYKTYKWQKRNAREQEKAEKAAASKSRRTRRERPNRSTERRTRR